MSEQVSILIVEDEQLDRELLCIILSMDPFIVNAMKSAEMVLEKIETASPPDLIITNEKLEGTSGIALIEKLRISVNWMDVPIIAIATDVSHTTVISLKKSGANAIISRPFDPERLQQEVLKLTGYERVEV